MKKLTTILVACMAFAMLIAAAQPAMGAAETLQGYWVEDYDGNASLMDAGVVMSAFATGDRESINDVGAGIDDSLGHGGVFGWDATRIDIGWEPSVPAIGDEVYFVVEHPDGYVWAAHREALGGNVADPWTDMFGQLEKIPTPVVVQNQDNEMVLEIEAPKYTCSYFDGEDFDTHNQGTFELFTGYRVYMEALSDPGNWVLVGDSTTLAAGADSPIVPNGFDSQAVDPASVDTGMETITATGLLDGESYSFRVSMVFDLGAAGEYETNIFGDPSPTELVPEFGAFTLVPVVAIIGMFVAFTVYRRKKEE